MAPGGNDQPLHPSVRLAVLPEPRLLGTVRLVVATAGRRAGLDDELVEDLKVAVSEICSAAIPSNDGAGTEIELDLFDQGHRFGVEIRDRSPVEAPATKAGPLDGRDFGLALVGSLVDELESAQRPGGGYVTRFWVDRKPRGRRA